MAALTPEEAWECRDNEDEAKTSYNVPLRRNNRILCEENLRLKRILRENGISWSPIAQAHIQQHKYSLRRRRHSASSHDSRCPRLPVEILLGILRLALTSPYAIVDPLSELTDENVSEKERARGNQIAIHFLATCKAFHTEGTRFLWESNSFVFTTPEALRNFSELKPEYREKITSLNLRIIARYYDDQRRTHRLARTYHPDLKKDQLLRVRLRPKESPLIRGGFRCYTWSQIADFLMALRAPYDPDFNDNMKPRPRLLPSLSKLRIDLVNFSETLLPHFGTEMHDIASHELGRTLKELQVTGMPFDDAGMRASDELSDMLQDEGLYLDASAAFIAQSKGLQTLSGQKWCARVVRLRNAEVDGEDRDASVAEFPSSESDDELSAAPAGQGRPADSNKVIWKQVPVSREAEERVWVQFSRRSGYEYRPDWASDDEEELCPCCGEHHPMSAFLDEVLSHDENDGLDGA